jgi:hypothetical protein
MNKERSRIQLRNDWELSLDHRKKEKDSDMPATGLLIEHEGLRLWLYSGSLCTKKGTMSSLWMWH